MMTILLIVGGMSVLSSMLVIGAVVAPKRPMPEFGPGELACEGVQAQEHEGYAMTSAHLIPAPSH